MMPAALYPGPYGAPIADVASAHERVYRAVRARLMHGEIAPGTQLTLRGVASLYGVSTTPAREALRRLAAEGALQMTGTGRAMTVSLTAERLEELASLRALLETELASRALPRVHNALIERMERLDDSVRAAVAAGDATGYIRANLDFHRLLYLRAQAPAMLALVETVWLQLGPTMQALHALRQKRPASRNHRMILAALAAGDEPGLRMAIRMDVTAGLKLLSG